MDAPQLSFKDEKKIPVKEGDPVLGSFFLLWRLPAEKVRREFYRGIARRQSLPAIEQDYGIDDDLRQLGVECLFGFEGCTPEAIRACAPDEVGEENLTAMHATLKAHNINSFPCSAAIRDDLLYRSTVFNNAVVAVGMAASKVMQTMQAAEEARKKSLASGSPTGELGAQTSAQEAKTVA